MITTSSPIEFNQTNPDRGYSLLFPVGTGYEIAPIAIAAISPKVIVYESWDFSYSSDDSQSSDE